MIRHGLVVAGAAALITTAPAAADTHGPTPHLDQAVTAVEHLAAQGHGSRATRLEWAIHRFVHRRIRSSRNAKLPAAQRPTRVEDALRTGAGSCGTSSAVALAIAQRVGLAARPVQFYYSADGAPASHMAWEAWSDGAWHFHDAYFNAVYRARSGRVLSIRRLLRLPSRVRLKRLDAGPDRDREGDPHPWHYIAGPSDVVIDGEGTVNAWQVGGRYRAVPDRPNYIGVTHRDGTPGSFDTHIALHFGNLTQPYLRVAITHTSCASGQLIAESRITTSSAVTTATTTLALPVSGAVARLSVDGGCAVVISEVINVSEAGARPPAA